MKRSFTGGLMSDCPAVSGRERGRGEMRVGRDKDGGDGERRF